MKATTAAAALSLILASAASGDDKRAIAETDLFDFAWVADPQISPDGSSVAFARVTVDRKGDRYDTALWIVPASGAAEPRQLTAGPRDLAPRWSPDGRQLAFLRAPEKEGKPQPYQVHILSMQGGEARAVTDLPKGTGVPVWSPEGKTLAFTATTTRHDLDKKTKAAARDAKEARSGAPVHKTEPERESDVRVITRAVYRFNGPGYLDPRRPSHIWTVEPPGSAEEPPKPRQITSGRFDEINVAWSADGSCLYFTSNRIGQPITIYDVP